MRRNCRNNLPSLAAEEFGNVSEFVSESFVIFILSISENNVKKVLTSGWIFSNVYNFNSLFCWICQSPAFVAPSHSRCTNIAKLFPPMFRNFFHLLFAFSSLSVEKLQIVTVNTLHSLCTTSVHPLARRIKRSPVEEIYYLFRNICFFKKDIL